jgi:hypothetical protein
MADICSALLVVSMDMDKRCMTGILTSDLSRHQEARPCSRYTRNGTGRRGHGPIMPISWEKLEGEYENALVSGKVPVYGDLEGWRRLL